MCEKMFSLYAILLGFGLDLIIGDPHGLYHPVRAIGLCITKLENIIIKILKIDRSQKERNEIKETWGGLLLFLCVCLISVGTSVALLMIADRISIYVKFIVETIICYQLVATKALKKESLKVMTSLQEQDIEKARYNLSMIVGRDTKNLNQENIIKAAVETVAENTSDGVIAPLLFLFLGGVPMGVLYKAINTMDSMIGYKNEKYIYLGRAAAIADDIVNFIPARLSALLMIAASLFGGFDMKNAWKIFKRDRFNHASPNSAQTEAVMAGALNIQLAGAAYYFGVLHQKPNIGDKNRQIEILDIKRANKLLYLTAFFVVIILGVGKYLVKML